MSKQRQIKDYKDKYIRQGILMGFDLYEQAIKETYGIGPVLSERIKAKAIELSWKKVRE